MNDPWFQKTNCDRCGASLSGGFRMSIFNTDALCHKCLEEERMHPDYEYAREVEMRAVRSGDRDFPGVGWPGKNGRVKR